MVTTLTPRLKSRLLDRRSTVSPLLWQIAQEEPEDALRTLSTLLEGLTEAEVEKRLRQHGKNEVTHEKPPPWYVQFAKAFYNPFIIVLFILGIVSYITDIYLPGQEVRGWKQEHPESAVTETVPVSAPSTQAAKEAPEGPDWTKVIILGVMISASGVLRFWQEFRSTKAAQKLKGMVRTTATVFRRRKDGSTNSMPSIGWTDRQEVPISEIVPGDIVHLSAGDMVPADVRLLSAKDIFVSQSVLTGESLPVEKYDTLGAVVEKSATEKFFNSNNPLEMGTLCFMGTNVVSGTGKAVVVATGQNTFFGSLTSNVLGHRAMTSFDKGVNKVTFVLIKFMLIMVPIVMLINGITKGNWHDAFLFGLAVAVGLTPEMLPLVVSANLARGAVKLSKQKVIVKRLNSIQNFGAMNILCTDKTGTLTEDKVVLVRHIDPQGQKCQLVLKYAFLNSFFQTGLKNLLDRAVIEEAQELSLANLTSDYIKVDEVPFDFVRRRMSVILRPNNLKHSNRVLICKGAVEEILDTCAQMRVGDSNVHLTKPERSKLKKMHNELNTDGLRVVGVAYKPVERMEYAFSAKDEVDLILAGFIAFLDPPKPSARDAIKVLNDHGVTVKVITGDNAIVATKICQQVELNPGTVIEGQQTDELSDKELGKLAERTTVFAKMNPLQKARVIRVLKARGHTVGYMGDGINDAAALRDADVGISVDTAVDIAKESADIILLEKSLMILEQGVIQGRVVFGNIVKYLKMTASSNFGNVFSVLVASAFIPFLPMLAIHLLIQNLLYDFSQISLPWDKVDPEFLEKPRKWETGSLAKFMVFIGPISSIFDIITYYLMWFVFGANSPEKQSLFQSGWFIEGLLSQTLIVHMIRTQKIPFVQSTAASPVLLLTASIMAIGVIVPFTPFGASIGLQALPLSYFPWLAATLLSYCVLTQIIKVIYIRKFKTWL